MQRGRYSNIGMAWAVCAALVLACAIWPAIADVPAEVLIKPLAVCEKGKCVMSQKDYETLQKFHERVMDGLQRITQEVAEVEQENAQLRGLLSRDAAGCKGKRT